MCFALDSLDWDPIVHNKCLRAIKYPFDDIPDTPGEAKVLGTLLRHTAPLSLDLVIVRDMWDFDLKCIKNRERGHCAKCPRCGSNMDKFKVLGKMLNELREENNVVNVRPMFYAETQSSFIRCYEVQRTVDFITKMLKFYMQELKRGESSPGLELLYDVPIIPSVDGIGTWRGLW